MKNRITKTLAFVLAIVLVLNTMVIGMAFAADGEVVLAAANAVCTGKALGKNNTAYNSKNNQISNIGPDSTITYTVPDDFTSGSYDIYLEVGKANSTYGSTPFYVSINGDTYTTPQVPYVTSSTKTVNDYGLFELRAKVELKAGDKITVVGQLGFEMGTRSSMMPTIRDIKIYPAGTEVALGYNAEIPVKEEVDPADPLSGRTIIWLGSSVTYGQQANGYSMADLIAETHPATTCLKYAISGTTLVDVSASSYVNRMKYIDKSIDADLFIVQLSTNDATTNKPLGVLSESFDMNDFDTTTIYGAMEYIIAYAQQTWKCPVMFYSGSYYDSAAYGNMDKALLAIQAKWGIDIVDLYNVEEMTAIYNSALYKTYMKDTIHPNKNGYVYWWGPYFQTGLRDAMAGDQQYVIIDSATAGYGDIINLNITMKNNEKGFSSYRLFLETELDVKVSQITSSYSMEWNKVDGGYMIVVYTADGSLVTGDSVLATVTIDLSNDVFPDGDYALDLTYIDGTTAEDAKISQYIIDGVLTIANNYPAGDVTMDCHVTNADVIAIARYLVKLVDFNAKQLEIADANGDGKVTNTDLIITARAVVAE